MRKLFFLLSLFTGYHCYSQNFKDTSFLVRGYTCPCKYNINIADDNRVFNRSENPAQYPGGEEEWKKFVKKNIDKGFKGKHEVELRFEVDKNGDLGEFLLLNKVPYQKYEEVLRLLRLSGKWFPSVQNGYCVKSFVSLSFEL